MLSSYGLRQRPPTDLWDPASVTLPLGAKHDDHLIYKDTDDLATSTSDFVKRLYRMLEDKVYPNVVMWSTSGDAFVIKDVTEFTKNCLPRAFKHSNFASFVRQLNKYDFHKVKSSDAGVTGDQAWVFKHPQFRSGYLDGLEHIKRKAPTQRKPTVPTAVPEEPVPLVSNDNSTRGLQTQIDALNASHDHLRNVIERLEANHQSTLRELVAMQRTVAQQDVLIQTLLQHLLSQAGNQMSSMQLPALDSSLDNSLFGMNSASSGSSKGSSNSQANNMFDLSLPMDFSPNASLASMTPILSPSSDDTSPPKNDTDDMTALFEQMGATTTFSAPNWAKPPRVLLVDDDAVSRTVSTRFLQDTGCVFDVANDGAIAVDKVRSNKYDLVLMDIVMPHLDGISATTQIRQFDMVTPIVSMTGNGETSDVVSYMSAGMTDVLIKPFSKDSLLTLLNKHLGHLRAMNAQQQQKVEFTDADYTAMMQQFINTTPSDSTGMKRPLEESMLVEPSAKKSRFSME